jgi:hypothetical protein
VIEPPTNRLSDAVGSIVISNGPEVWMLPPMPTAWILLSIWCSAVETSVRDWQERAELPGVDETQDGQAGAGRIAVRPAAGLLSAGLVRRAAG